MPSDYVLAGLAEKEFDFVIEVTKLPESLKTYFKFELTELTTNRVGPPLQITFWFIFSNPYQQFLHGIGNIGQLSNSVERAFPFTYTYHHLAVVSGGGQASNRGTCNDYRPVQDLTHGIAYSFSDSPSPPPKSVPLTCQKAGMLLNRKGCAARESVGATIPNCYAQMGSMCTQCIPTYFSANSPACSPCPPNCYHCVNGAYCLVCKYGFIKIAKSGGVGFDCIAYTPTSSFVYIPQYQSQFPNMIQPGQISLTPSTLPVTPASSFTFSVAATPAASSNTYIEILVDANSVNAVLEDLKKEFLLKVNGKVVQVKTIAAPGISRQFSFQVACTTKACRTLSQSKCRRPLRSS